MLVKYYNFLQRYYFPAGVSVSGYWLYTEAKGVTFTVGRDSNIKEERGGTG